MNTSGYPFSGRFLDLDGLKLHYLDEGRGEPVVMVHGNPTWSYTFRKLVLALRDSCRVIVPDHIGCGLSDKPGDDRYDYTLERRVSDLEFLLDRLGLDRDVTLVLHDWGGMIGMAAAHRRPERVKRLIILNTAAFHLPAGKRLPLALRVCRLPGLGPLLVRGLNVFCRGAARVCFQRRPPAAVRSAYLRPYNSWANRIAVLRFVQDIPLRPGDRAFDLVTAVENGLDRFREVPMFLLWGERDFVFDAEILAEWIRRFPDAVVRRFPSAGHFVLEDAGEEIIPFITQVLRSGEGAKR